MDCEFKLQSIDGVSISDGLICASTFLTDSMSFELIDVSAVLNLEL